MSRINNVNKSCSPSVKILVSSPQSSVVYGISPMTNLSNNLGTTLKIRRNLRFSSNGNSPEKNNLFKNGASVTEANNSLSGAQTVIQTMYENFPTPTSSNSNTSQQNMSSPPRQPVQSINNFKMTDKENASQTLELGITPFPTEYEESPSKLFFNSPRVIIQKNVSRNRFPLEDYDPNSQDSGYSNSSSSAAFDEINKSPSSFRFRQPSGLAPRRNNTAEFSPRSTSASMSPPSPLIYSQKMYHISSTGSSELSDDGFMDQLPEAIPSENIMDQDENAQLPPGFNSLLSGTIFGFHKITESPVSSLVSENKTRSVSFRSALKTSFDDFMHLKDVGSGKRLATETEGDTVPFLKRRRINKLSISTREKSISLSQPATAPISSSPRTLLDYGFKKTNVKFQRSFSETDAAIIQAVERGSTDPNLIGDFSRRFALPLEMGRHSDLKNISCKTLAQLLAGEFDDCINSYMIVDCRYPYEYNGGHIKGAVNIYTEDQVINQFMEKKISNGSSDTASSVTTEIMEHPLKRNILIFHCEFSSERGPTMSRYLREMDRKKNCLHYPQLDYPEIYLLDGGYKRFYERYKELCDPCSYKPMLHPDHSDDLRTFKARSKSSVSITEGRSKSQLRTKLKRLGL